MLTAAPNAILQHFTLVRPLLCITTPQPHSMLLPQGQAVFI